MSRPRKTATPPSEILAQDGRQKAVLIPQADRSLTWVIADYYSLAGAVNGTSSYWKWNRRAEVRMQPQAAALAMIQRIVDTPFPKRR